jgi:hypothetical protein
MQLREEIATYSEDHTKFINTACGQNAQLLNTEAGSAHNNQCASREEFRCGLHQTNP